MKKMLLGIGLAGMLSAAASAQPAWGHNMNLSQSQRQQIRDILRNGNFQDPANRQQMGQQIADIVGQSNANELSGWNRQYGRHHHRNGNGNNGWYSAGNANGTCAPNNGQAYYNPGYPNNSVYNSGYYNSSAYNPGYYNSSAYNPGYYNSSAYNPGYYTTANPYNTAYTNPYAYNTNYNTGAYPYYPQGYYPGNYYNGANMGLNVLSGLLNSGILNGMFGR